jgi:hypothetical protein
MHLCYSIGEFLQLQKSSIFKSRLLEEIHVKGGSIIIPSHYFNRPVIPISRAQENFPHDKARQLPTYRFINQFLHHALSEGENMHG